MTNPCTISTISATWLAPFEVEIKSYKEEHVLLVFCTHGAAFSHVNKLKLDLSFKNSCSPNRCVNPIKPITFEASIIFCQMILRKVVQLNRSL